MPRPYVSVLIDTYNHERFIEEAVNSVLAQDFSTSDREILVVDDGSTDRTPDILKKFVPKIRVLHKSNGGQASAFNCAIPECRGEVVSFLDADDWWVPNKLARVADALAAEPEVGFVGHGIVNVYQDGTRITEVLRDGFYFQADTVSGALLFSRRGAFMGTSRMTVRNRLLQRVGPIPEEIRIQADEYIYTLAAVLMPMRILPEALTFYRMHEANEFQISGADPQKVFRKQKALAALAKVLSQRLAAYGIDQEVLRTLLKYTQACADQLRLSIEGGWPWETLQTEWKMYQACHPDATHRHQVFKLLVLMGALFVTPRGFYRIQKRLSQNGLYRRLRKRFLPFPEMHHIGKEGPG